MEREKIRQLFRENKVVLLCGEWLSLGKPAGFVPKVTLRDEMIILLSEDTKGARIFRLEDALEEETLLVKENLLPEILVGEIVIQKREFLPFLKETLEGEPNENHRLIARLAKEGKVSVIVDASWETYLERALLEIAPDIDVHILKEDREFGELLLKIKRGDPMEGVYLLKIFGDLNSESVWKKRRDFWDNKISGTRRDLMSSLMERYYLAFWGWEEDFWWEDGIGELLAEEESSCRGVIWSLLEKERPTWEVETIRAIYGEEKWASVKGDFAHLLREVLGGEEVELGEVLEEDPLEQRVRDVIESLGIWIDEHLENREKDFLMGQIFLKSLEEEIAAKYFEKILREVGEEEREWRWNCLVSLGEAYLFLGKNQEAMDCCSKILKEAEKEPVQGEREKEILNQAILNLCSLDITEERWQEGMNLCRKFLEEKPTGELSSDERDCLFDMGWNLFYKGLEEPSDLFAKTLQREGIDLARTAWERRPAHTEKKAKEFLLWKLASMYMKMGIETEEKEFLSRLERDENESLFFLGKLVAMILLWQEGNKEEGAQILEELLREKGVLQKGIKELDEIEKDLVHRGSWSNFFSSKMEVLREAAEYLKQRGERKGEMMYFWLKGLKHFNREEYEPALEWAQKGAELALQEEAWEDYGHCSFLLARVRMEQKQWGKAWNCNCEVMELWKHHSDEMGEVVYLILIGMLCICTEEKKESRVETFVKWVDRVCQKPADQIWWAENYFAGRGVLKNLPGMNQIHPVIHRWAKEMGHRHLESHFAGAIVWDLFEDKKLEEAEALIEKHVSLWRDLGEEELLSSLYLVLGEKYFAEKKLDLARKNMEKGWSTADMAISSRLEILLLWGKLELVYGSTKEGLELLDQCVDVCMASPYTLDQSKNLRNLGITWLELKNFKKAEKIFQRAWDCLRKAESKRKNQYKLEIKLQKGILLQWQGTVNAELGRIGSAIKKWSQARDLFTELGYLEKAEDMRIAIKTFQDIQKIRERLDILPVREKESSQRPLPKEKEFSPRPLPKEKAGPNDPCPCGSGKKYKKCCEK